MKISYNWLKEFVDITIPPRQLAERLTMVGLAVDAVEEHGNDAVLEIDLTSNRPDCLSHLGVAREVAAILDVPLKKNLGTGRRGDGAVKTVALTSVEITAPELCPRYTARLIKGVKIGPSPDWLVKRLEVMGQRSVNNVADITNYVMLELGQPLHAFDFDMLRGQRIIVRRATEGEKIITLDKEERTLTSAMLVIADAERPVALGGIKGGEDSGISDKTVDVLLEAAYFTPAQIRATSKTLGLATEASYRFERGTDPEIAAVASDRAAVLIAEIAGGVISDELLDVYPGRETIHAGRQAISFRRVRYQALTGLDVELNTATRILGALGMPAKVDAAAQTLTTAAPTWRIDINIEEDLIEEIGRIEGYDKLQTTLPGSAGAGSLLPGERERRSVRQTLTAAGYHEAVSFSFVNAASDALFSEVSEAGRVGLSNPIDVELAQMRTNLLSGLLEALVRNFNQGTRNVRLFEFGKCFAHPLDGVDDERPVETEKLALVATGARNADDWQTSALPHGGRLDFYDVKGVLESLAEVLSIRDLEFVPFDSVTESGGVAAAYLHTGRAALIMHGSHTLGRMGQLHPRIATSYKFKQPVFVAELDFGALRGSERSEARYRPLPKFPQAQRDVALLIATAVNFAALETAIHALQIPELVSVRLFDLYAGKELPAGKHSLALSLSYRAANRTLTDEEVNAAHERLVQALKEAFGAEIR